MERQFKTTLKEILEASRERWQWKYGRSGEGDGKLEELDSSDEG